MTMQEEMRLERERHQKVLDEAQKDQDTEMKRLAAELRQTQEGEKQRQRQVEKQHQRETKEAEREHARRRRRLEEQMRGEDIDTEPTHPLESRFSLLTLAALMSAVLWTFVITILIAFVIHDASGRVPSQVNYCIFVAACSWFCIGVKLLPMCIPALRKRAATVLFVVLFVVRVWTAIFVFVAAVVLAAKLGVHSCFNQVRLISLHMTISSWCKINM